MAKGKKRTDKASVLDANLDKLLLALTNTYEQGKQGGAAKEDGVSAEQAMRIEQEDFRLQLKTLAKTEHKSSHVNGIKIHHQWRKILRKAKVEELKKALETISQGHERNVDRKDALIQMLHQSLDEAEEQHQTAVRTHAQGMDKLVDLQYQRIHALHNEFNNELQLTQEQFDSERLDITNAHSRQKKEMNDVLSAMRQQFRDEEAELNQEFESQREEIKNRNSEEYNVLKMQLEGTIEELERHLEQAHKTYLETSEHRAQAFKDLVQSDANSARLIENRNLKLSQIQEDLQSWRIKISSNARDWECRNEGVRAEKETITRHYSKLKSTMDTFNAIQKEKLIQLSTYSEKTQAELTEKLEKATFILKLAEMCRKLEKEQEKVMPFNSLDETQVPQRMEDRASGAAQGVKRPTDADSSQSQLEPLFRRINRAIIDKATLDKEQTLLEKENEDLRSLIDQYSMGTNVSNDVLDSPENPLLIVNERFQLGLAQRAKKPYSSIQNMYAQ